MIKKIVEMTIYYIRYERKTSDNSFSTLRIGFTSTKLKADEVIAKYSLLQGFKDSKNGYFKISEHKITVELPLFEINIFYIETPNDKSVKDGYIEKGPYPKFRLAIKAKSKYKKMDKYKNCKSYILKFRLDETFYWPNGFDNLQNFPF
jgi:hypothetical protein